MVVSKEEQSVIDVFVDRDAQESTDDSLSNALRTLILTVEDVFVFSERAVLLWSGCTRKSSHYTYPDGFMAKWKERRLGAPDYRMHNGPPNSAFKLAGGRKPKGWHLDHIYDGLHFWSARNGLHFTQTAGLVAMTPQIHNRRHSDAQISWVLRGVAFRKFGYDPAKIFSTGLHDELGFVAGRSCEVFWQ
jgi:hypothetical protein